MRTLGVVLVALLLVVLVIHEHRETPDPHARLLQVHHGFIGALLVGTPWVWMQGIGVGVLLDDLVQHAVQLKRPGYRSPLHRWAHALGLI